MPKKYLVKVKLAAPRFEPISKYCIIESKPCLHCRLCVKNDVCVYGVNEKRGFDILQVLDTGDYQCMGCLRCIQECKANILSRTINPRFYAMGDDYWNPDIISSLWNQATTGKIPVSGAGYRGPFCGPGFDRMWTDMSEIVRPTRDGIHGREYISTVVELGRRPERLEFDNRENLITEAMPFYELQIPIILDMPAVNVTSELLRKVIARAATELHTVAVANCSEAGGLLADYRRNLIVRFNPQKESIDDVEGALIVELAYVHDVMDTALQIKAKNPTTIISIRLPLDENAAERASELVKAGTEIIHLQASCKGKGLGKRSGDFITKLVREVHLRLVQDDLREQITIVITGGIAMAEHVAKIIICGVDAVGIDLALMAALECRLCKDCSSSIECPVAIDKIPEDYGMQRIVNLVGSWHSQLIEVMGAMGIREVRRLRGEVGRAMFFQDLEKDNFLPIFSSQNWKSPVQVKKVKPALLEERWNFPLVEGAIKEAPTRYRNRLNKYKVVRNSQCVACGRCAEVCMYGVHQRSGNRMTSSQAFQCVGPEVCQKKGVYCVDACPHGALRVGLDPIWNTFGDARWPADLLVSTWIQAETGRPPDNGLEYRVGASGGGFDKIDFIFPDSLLHTGLKPQDVDLTISLNRRNDDNRPRIDIGFPVYSGGMSFGSISLAMMIGKAKAYKEFNSFTCTGEGGYPAALVPYDNNVITQVATGLFGVREETIQRVRIVEFKYAQGAKPGLGGHLLGDKVTPAVAKLRESVVGNSLFSPFPFHSVYSVEDHKKHVDWVKAVNPKALISVKVSSPTDVDMVAVGSYYAGAHIIHIDGSYGGTGAAPDIAKKNIAMPIEYAIPKVHRFLIDEGIRDQITLIASGGIRTAWDIAKIIALGADGVVLGTSEMVALECIRCSRCESGRGCPRGIATTDPELSNSFDSDWAAQRLINLFHSYAIQLQEILWRFGMKSVKELVGRSDLLIHYDYLPKSPSIVRDVVYTR